MIRTQVYLTEKEKKSLEKMARETGMSQSDLIRSAIDSYLARSAGVDRMAVLDDVCGVWKSHKEGPDIRDLRTGWRRRSDQ